MLQLPSRMSNMVKKSTYPLTNIASAQEVASNLL